MPDRDQNLPAAWANNLAGMVNRAETYSSQRPGSGDGTGGSDLEARVARLEAHVEHIDGTLTDIKQDIRDIRSDIKSDFRLLFGALIAVALGLAGLMAKGFGWLS